MSSILIRRANMVAAGSGPTPGRLPAGYTELVYLESSGTQYIDMTCAAEKSLFFGIDADIWVLHNSDSRYAIFSANPYGQFETAFYSYSSSTNSSTFSSYVGGKNASGGWTAVVGEKTNLILSTEGKTVNGTHTALSRPLTTDLVNFRLFGTYRNTYRYPVRIGEFKIKSGAALLRDLVPAMRNSDRTVGMYDLVSNTFLTNAGSGTFSYGTL